MAFLFSHVKTGHKISRRDKGIHVTVPAGERARSLKDLDGFRAYRR